MPILSRREEDDIRRILGNFALSGARFYYHGNGYTICWARGYFPDVDLGVAPFDGTGDEFRLFHGLDDLLDNCIIEGKSLREILPEIEM